MRKWRRRGTPLAPTPGKYLPPCCFLESLCFSSETKCPSWELAMAAQQALQWCSHTAVPTTSSKFETWRNRSRRWSVNNSRELVSNQNYLRNCRTNLEPELSTRTEQERCWKWHDERCRRGDVPDRSVWSIDRKRYDVSTYTPRFVLQLRMRINCTRTNTVRDMPRCRNANGKRKNTYLSYPLSRGVLYWWAMQATPSRTTGCGY